MKPTRQQIEEYAAKRYCELDDTPSFEDVKVSFGNIICDKIATGMEMDHAFFAELPMDDEIRFLGSLIVLLGYNWDTIVSPNGLLALAYAPIDQLLLAYYQAGHEG